MSASRKTSRMVTEKSTPLNSARRYYETNTNNAI